MTAAGMFRAKEVIELDYFCLPELFSLHIILDGLHSISSTPLNVPGISFQVDTSKVWQK
jgi:hypothetical protein